MVALGARSGLAVVIVLALERRWATYTVRRRRGAPASFVRLRPDTINVQEFGVVAA
jgi:hypothetical protein